MSTFTILRNPHKYELEALGIDNKSDFWEAFNFHSIDEKTATVLYVDHEPDSSPRIIFEVNELSIPIKNNNGWFTVNIMN